MNLLKQIDKLEEYQEKLEEYLDEIIVNAEELRKEDDNQKSKDILALATISKVTMERIGFIKIAKATNLKLKE
jgi:hypothetical protein